MSYDYGNGFDPFMFNYMTRAIGGQVKDALMRVLNVFHCSETHEHWFYDDHREKNIVRIWLSNPHALKEHSTLLWESRIP